ncbi:hypothetical protein MPSEU_000614000 [Mayamaea pseudoterrestris]|nr:hypothetical protein MPSEU_000614000 [Mayamaea pseudoterrestris]
MTISNALASINTPPFVGTTGALTLTIVPILEQAIIGSAIPFLGVQIMNLLFYMLNTLATSQSGRIDGIEQEQDVTTSKAVEAFRTGKRGRTLFMPQGWAFAIWGPIFSGELAMCTSTALFVKESMSVAPIIKEMSGGFIGSQIFQALWCASFRPSYTGRSMFVSSAMLSGVAYCLNRAHRAFVYAKTDAFTYCIHFLPISMHFAWATAATLVNLNGNVATISDDPKVIAWTGHLSAIGATALGVFITLSRTAPVYGGVIAWALLACSAGMNQRVSETTKEAILKPGVYGARTQKWLCAAGAAICSCASVVAAAKVFQD